MKKYGTAGEATDENITRRIRTACRITRATDTHPEYAILINFPRQQWLRERKSVLRYTYSAVLNSSVGTGRSKQVQFKTGGQSVSQC